MDMLRGGAKAHARIGGKILAQLLEPQTCLFNQRFMPVPQSIVNLFRLLAHREAKVFTGSIGQIPAGSA